MDPNGTPLLMTLHDGTTVLLRPIVPDDRDAVLAAFRNLSPDSRYSRFWTRYEQLPDPILQRFLHADQVSHAVWAALDPDRPGDPGFGAGSWWRVENGDHNSDAEVSFTVADAAQHRGVGTLLLAVLWHQALRQGISRFQAHVLPDNYAVLEWFRSLGANPVFSRGQFTITLTLDISALPDSTRAARNLRRSLELLAARAPSAF